MEKQEKGRHSKEKILRAAQEYFKSGGIDSVTIDDICKKAGAVKEK